MLVYLSCGALSVKLLTGSLDGVRDLVKISSEHPHYIKAGAMLNELLVDARRENTGAGR